MFNENKLAEGDINMSGNFDSAKKRMWQPSKTTLKTVSRSCFSLSIIAQIWFFRS